VAPVYAHDDGDEEWELDAIVKKRVVGRGEQRGNQYLVWWQGHGPEHDHWYDEEDLENAQKLLAEFEKKQKV
jgi:streptomycin 6-kinase